NEHGKKKIINVFRYWLPMTMVPVFIVLLGLDPEKECHQISSKERKQIRYLLKNLRFRITNHRPFKEAIITAGGVSTNEISSKTMESKVVKGLYFAGEMIDLDAETGGYNLQIAYSTGWLAGNSCMR
ncbi:MAG: NAD(P)/FAD-dependent oxidoreductase, partial [Nitrosopumilus sp.]